MPKRSISVQFEIFAKPRRSQVERLARLERMADRRTIEAVEAARAVQLAVQEEAATWTPEKSKIVEAARVAEADAANWARATALATVEARKLFEAREAAYKKAEKLVTQVFIRVRDSGGERET